MHGENCDTTIHLAGDENVVLTFDDFDMKRTMDALYIFDTLVSTATPIKSFSSYRSPTLVTLSGNRALIRLKVFACSPFSRRCDTNTGRGFKIRVGIGKSWQSIDSFSKDFCFSSLIILPIINSFKINCYFS